MLAAGVEEGPGADDVPARHIRASGAVPGDQRQDGLVLTASEIAHFEAFGFVVMRAPLSAGTRHVMELHPGSTSRRP